MANISQSAVLKREIEAQLSSRIPSALSPQVQQAPRLMPCGIAEIDTMLAGGLPIGGVSELTGLASSGRTSLAFSLLAEATSDSACAYIDVSDTLDPRSAAATGVNFNNLLWVRLPNAVGAQVVREPDSTHFAGEFTKQGAPIGGHCGSHHPRSEMTGIGPAIGELLAHKVKLRSAKMEGTPGHPNRSLSLVTAPKEQVEYEHFNARHADASDPLRQADHRAAQKARERTEAPAAVRTTTPRTRGSWSRMDQAIRATDQILQSGGFRLVILDLASVLPEESLRIPSATWFRFRRAAQESDAILLLLTQVACARSSALCVLDCSEGTTDVSNGLMRGLSYDAEVVRQRLSSPSGRKAPGRAMCWTTTPQWMRAAGE